MGTQSLHPGQLGNALFWLGGGLQCFSKLFLGGLEGLSIPPS